MSIEMNSRSIEGFEDVRTDLGALGEHDAVQGLRGLGGLALSSMPGGSEDRRWSQQDIPAGKSAGVLIEIWARATNATTLRSRLDAGIKSALRAQGFTFGESASGTQTVTLQRTKSVMTAAQASQDTLIIFPPTVTRVAVFRSRVASPVGSLQAGMVWSSSALYQTSGNDASQLNYAAAVAAPSDVPHGAISCAVYRIVAQPTDGKFDLGRARALNSAIKSTVSSLAGAANLAAYGYHASFRVQPVSPIGGSPPIQAGVGGGSWWMWLVAGAAVLATTGSKTAGAAKAAPFVAKGAAVAAKKAGALFAQRGV